MSNNTESGARSMSMTTELAQRMKAAAIRAKAATEDYVANRMSISVCLSECELFNNLSDGPDNIIALVEAMEARDKQIAKDVQIKARLCRESNSLHDRLRDAEKRIAEQARIIELLNEHGYEVQDHEINESNIFDAVELLLTQLIEAQETPSDYELVRGQLLIAHRTLLNQRAKIAELETRTVTVKLSERYSCELGYNSPNPNGDMLDRDDVLAMLAAVGIQVIEGDQSNG